MSIVKLNSSAPAVETKSDSGSLLLVLAVLAGVGLAVWHFVIKPDMEKKKKQEQESNKE